MMKLKELAIQKLKERGVEITDIADIVLNYKKTHQDLTVDDCINTIDSIIEKGSNTCCFNWHCY